MNETPKPISILNTTLERLDIHRSQRRRETHAVILEPSRADDWEEK
jgi:hypothetical protein